MISEIHIIDIKNIRHCLISTIQIPDIKELFSDIKKNHFLISGIKTDFLISQNIFSDIWKYKKIAIFILQKNEYYLDPLKITELH